MKSILFLLFCFIGYVVIIAFLIVKAKDISRNPARYEVIPGYQKYRNSFWYERKYNRYGKHYHASLIIGLISLIFCFPAYILFGFLIRKYLLLPPGAFYLRTYQLYIGGIACVFFQIFFELWISFHSKAPICIANSLYVFQHDNRSSSWAKLTRSMLITCILCLPIMFISIHAYSYADEEKIVTHNFLSIEETRIPYDTIVSAETAYTTNEEYTEFHFSYHILLQNGTRINIMDFGTEGVLYLHPRIQQQNIPITYGQINSVTHELIKRTCKDSTIELVESCFVIIP